MSNDVDFLRQVSSNDLFLKDLPANTCVDLRVCSESHVPELRDTDGPVLRHLRSLSSSDLPDFFA